ncbi:uncharacterized protein G2W53_028085 [Senna tora]|uniref:Uncharacterized protein n=1 Tax=Senna tora TaxID=362788 RepID=A0A834WCI0_9FABA|nr:uncharacterized protein G2W53_028085 [Senna tora]
MTGQASGGLSQSYVNSQELLPQGVSLPGFWDWMVICHSKFVIEINIFNPSSWCFGKEIS